MLLRICLIIGIVAGALTTFFGLDQVKDIIVTTRAARDDFHTKLTAETSLQHKTEATLKKTEANLADTTSKLTESQTELAAANTKNADLSKQNTDLNDRLTKVTARADTAEQKLEQWNLLGLDPTQIKGLKADLAKATAAKNTMIAENKILASSRDDLQARLDSIIGPDAAVLLPVGLKGKILAVDPKYDFVVLNIGQDQGAKTRGEMMVDHNGKLLGKVRITTVAKDRCVANILPGWQRGDIMEGDQVLY